MPERFDSDRALTPLVRAETTPRMARITSGNTWGQSGLAGSARPGPLGARAQSGVHAIDLPPLDPSSTRQPAQPNDESGVRARPHGQGSLPQGGYDDAGARSVRESSRVPSSSGARVQSILDSAASCFARRGFTATTLADIGLLLGLRKSIVHYYFSGKAALVREVQDSTSASYLKSLERTLGSTSARAGEHEQQPPQSGEAVRTGEPAGVAGLWQLLAESPTQRGLNLEYWAAARREPELGSVAASVRDRANELLIQALQTNRSGGEAAKKASSSSRATGDDAAALATLTMAVLDGLTVLAEETSARRERGEIDDDAANARMRELARSYALFVERCAGG